MPRYKNTPRYGRACSGFINLSPRGGCESCRNEQTGRGTRAGKTRHTHAQHNIHTRASTKLSPCHATWCCISGAYILFAKAPLCPWALYTGKRSAAIGGTASYWAQRYMIQNVQDDVSMCRQPERVIRRKGANRPKKGGVDDEAWFVIQLRLAILSTHIFSLH